MPSRQLWEHKLVPIQNNGWSPHENLDKQLRQLELEGWELVQVYKENWLIVKRPSKEN